MQTIISAESTVMRILNVLVQFRGCRAETLMIHGPQGHLEKILWANYTPGQQHLH